MSGKNEAYVVLPDWLTKQNISTDNSNWYRGRSIALNKSSEHEAIALANFIIFGTVRQTSQTFDPDVQGADKKVPVWEGIELFEKRISSLPFQEKYSLSLENWVATAETLAAMSKILDPYLQRPELFSEEKDEVCERFSLLVKRLITPFPRLFQEAEEQKLLSPDEAADLQRIFDSGTPKQLMDRVKNRPSCFGLPPGDSRHYEEVARTSQAESAKERTKRIVEIKQKNSAIISRLLRNRIPDVTKSNATDFLDVYVLRNEIFTERKPSEKTWAYVLEKCNRALGEGYEGALKERKQGGATRSAFQTAGGGLGASNSRGEKSTPEGPVTRF